MSTILITMSVLACAAIMADAPLLAVLICWLGLSGVVALVFGAASLIGGRPGEGDQ